MPFIVYVDDEEIASLDEEFSDIKVSGFLKPFVKSTWFIHEWLRGTYVVGTRGDWIAIKISNDSSTVEESLQDPSKLSL